MRQLRLTTFGGLHFRSDDGCELRFATRKTAALVAYLCLHPERRMNREFLCGLFWSERSETQARHSLSQALSEARWIIGSHILQVEGEAISLDHSKIWVDAIEFAKLADEKTGLSLRQAESLYKGDFLSHCELGQEQFDDWVMGERERFRHLAHWSFSTALALQVGDSDQSLATARSMIALDPFDESAHRVMMRAYAAQGCASFAIEHYHQLALSLRQELGLLPSTETQELFQSLAKHAAPQTLAQFAFVLEQMPHPVVVTDLQSRIVGWNRLAELAYGFTKSEIFGLSPTLVYGPDRNPGLADSILKRALQSGQWSKRVSMVSKGGQQFQQRRIVAPLYDAMGTLVGAFGYGVNA